MFSFKKKGIIYLKREGLELCIRGVPYPLKLDFGTDAVSNLQITKKEAIYGQIDSFISKNALKPMECVMVLAEEIIFKKTIDSPKKEIVEQETADFLGEVPFETEMLQHKTIMVQTGATVFAVNKDFYGHVKHGFEMVEWSIEAVVPEGLFGESVGLKACKDSIVFKSKDLVKMGNFLTAPSDEVQRKEVKKKNGGSEEKKPKEPGKKSTKKILMIVVGALLLVGFAAGIYWFLFLKPDVGVEESKTVNGMVENVDEAGVTEESTESESEEVEVIEKGDLTLQILNGTGVSGLAATIKSSLALLEFENIEIANSPLYEDDETLVEHNGIQDDIINEIVEDLEKTFAVVKVVNLSEDGEVKIEVDIRITTGKSLTE